MFRKTFRNRKFSFRGSTFYLETEEDFWELPDNINDFKGKFQQRLKEFYQLLNDITGIQFNYRNLRGDYQIVTVFGATENSVFNSYTASRKSKVKSQKYN